MIEKQSEAIRKYETMTGIYQSSEELMQENYDLKFGQCEDCVPDLEKCSLSLTLFKGKARRRGVIIAIAVPAAAAVGYGIGTLAK